MMNPSPALWVLTASSSCFPGQGASGPEPLAEPRLTGPEA